MNERMGKPALLHHRWAGNVFHLHADALSGDGGADPALFAIHGSGLSAETAAAADVHDLCGDHHDCGPVLFFVINLFWRHVQGTESQRQSVGSDHAGVDDRDSATA